MIRGLEHIGTTVSNYFYNFPQMYIVPVATPSEALTHIYESNPLVYIIIVGLVIAIGALTATLRMLWKRYEGCHNEVSGLHKEKLEIALTSTDTIKEALFLVQNIHKQILELNKSESARKVVENDVKNHLINLSDGLDDLKRDLKEYISKLNLKN